MNALRPLTHYQSRPGPVVLCIMDGVGYGKYPEGDAVQSACTPHLDWLHANCPGLRLKAHGTAVGMPSDGDMGNSEIGHNAIGCGRVFDQGAKLVSQAIASGRLFAGKTWQHIVKTIVDNGSTLHFIGLMSDGNVHSHLDHLRAMVDRAHESGVQRLRVHGLLDGRDVGETSALDYFDPFEAFLAEHSQRGVDYCIASGGGRMFITMDRYGADWEMVHRGWQVHVRGEGRQFANAHEAIATLRGESGAIDQDLGSFVIARDGRPVGAIRDGDAVVLFNFRGDRMLELCAAFEDDEFDKFDRGVRPQVTFASMMEYDGDRHVPAHYLVEPPAIDETIGEYLAAAGVRQLAISETQKFGHVTYFFNGNRTNKFSEEFETYVEVKSDRVPFEERPWMKAAEITDAVIASMRKGDSKFMRVNFPNGDMVGHTGNLQAAEIAVETVDLCLGRLLPVARKTGAILVVTADHGNADDMYERDQNGAVKLEDGRPKMKTCHSLNPVPCLIFDPQGRGDYQLTTRQDLGISSLTATCLNLLGFEAPENYDPSVITF